MYTHYTVEDGLPSSEVYQALQASDGHLWFATDHGVSRYDGYSFQTYTTDNGLCDQVVFCMHEDARQRLWFATYSGCMFYYENGQFTPFQWNDALQAALPGSIINGIWVDDQDTVWLDLNRGRSIKVTPNGEVLHIYPKNDNPLYDQEVYQIGEGAYVFDRGERSATLEDPEVYQTVIYRKGGQEPVQFNWSGFPEGGVIWGIPMQDGGIAVSWGHLLMRWRAATGTTTEVGLPASQTISLMEDRQGDLWVGMRNRGAYCFPGGDPSAVPEHYLDGKAVSSVLQDHEGNYWLTTLDDGIYLLRSKAIRLYNREGGLPSQHMVGVAGTKHAVWAGTYLGDLFRVPITGDDSLTAKFMGQFGQFGTIRSVASGALLTNADGLKVRICGEASGKVERLPEGELIAPYYPQGEVIFLENTVQHIIRILLRNDSVIHHETTTPSPAFVARTFCTDASGLHWVGALDGL
ncbi:MAG: two-component regulator propeller domain-containing protein, partial [Bacteroidota bacterium]